MSRVSVKRQLDVLYQDNRSPSCCSHRLLVDSSTMTPPSNSSITIQSEQPLSEQPLSERKQTIIHNSEEQNNYELINRSFKRVRIHPNQMEDSEADTNTRFSRTISASIDSKLTNQSYIRDDPFTQAGRKIPLRKLDIDSVIVGQKKKKRKISSNSLQKKISRRL